MKHIYSSFLVFLVFFGTIQKSRSQDFTISMLTDTVITGVPGQEVVAYATIINNTALPVEIDIIRIENNMANGWSSSLCVDVCLPPNIDSTRLYLPANQTQLFTFHFYSGMTADSSNANVLFRKAGNPSESYEQRLYAETDSIYLSLPESGNFASKFNLYPNPVALGRSINLIVDAVVFDGNNQPLMLVMYDQMGGEIKRIEGIKTENYSFQPQNLSSGIYFYSIIQAGKILLSDKIILTDYKS